MAEKKKIIIKIKKTITVAEDQPISSSTSKQKHINASKEQTPKVKKKSDAVKSKTKKGTNEISELKDTDFDSVEKKIYELPFFDFFSYIAKEKSIQRWQVENTVLLLDEENTVPFISRYRKEKTGSLDEVEIRAIEKSINYLRTLQNRKKEVLSSILTQNKLTPDLEQKILDSMKLSEIEELYLPYKPKKKTRAIKAKEKGLEPLSIIMKTEKYPEMFAQQFINLELGVKTKQDALEGAADICAEEFAENFDIRSLLRTHIIEHGEFIVKKKNPDESDEFDMYKDYKEPVKAIKNHRILAINRGESKEKLTVKIEIEEDTVIETLYNKFVAENKFTTNSYFFNACKDGFKRLLFISISHDIRNAYTERAEKEAIEVFAQNLANLLMTPPLKNRRILAIDPGIRTGSKIAIIDKFGNFIAYDKFYQENEEEAASVIEKSIKKNNIDLVAIGNGTASRDVEKLIVSIIKNKDLNIKYLLVSETGASVYSASETARDEFPDLDVTIRGAISIGRRVLDPLAEFVKIDPKSLGVGQYQHDVNQKTLSEKLDEVVEDAVNKVGVLLNTASSKLLQYVSGISERVAKNIIAYRQENGPFTSRSQLFNVQGVGEKIFVQAAGFLRIPESKNPLDNSWIHPESYEIAQEIITIQDKDKTLNDAIKKSIAEKYSKGLETINDIIDDLKKPGRDPREDIEAPILKDDILSIEDLAKGMVLKGTVRNVTKFGAFVDIGVKHDGLIHISELSDDYVSDPLSKVHVGQIVEVTVLDIDKERDRISLTMKTGKKPRTVNDHQYKKPEFKQKAFNDTQTFGDLLKNLNKK